MSTLTKTKKPDPVRAHQFFRDKNEFTTGPMEVAHMLQEEPENIIVVDVRYKEDYDEEHIPRSVNLPPDLWDTESGLLKDKTNVLVCYTQQCHLASKAAEKFSAKGFPVMEMEGGFQAWKDSDLEVED